MNSHPYTGANPATTHFGLRILRRAILAQPHQKRLSSAAGRVRVEARQRELEQRKRAGAPDFVRALAWRYVLRVLRWTTCVSPKLPIILPFERDSAFRGRHERSEIRARWRRQDFLPPPCRPRRRVVQAEDKELP